jgi:hypothetical protein
MGHAALQKFDSSALILVILSVVIYDIIMYNYQYENTKGRARGQGHSL